MPAYGGMIPDFQPPWNWDDRTLDWLKDQWAASLKSGPEAIEALIELMLTVEDASHGMLQQVYDAELKLWRHNGAMLCPEFSAWVHRLVNRLKEADAGDAVSDASKPPGWGSW